MADRYRLDEPLGRSAWRAADLVLGRDVVIRLARLQRRGAFLRETLEWRVLEVPRVARVLDAGVDDGVAWVVSERVRGEPFPGPGLPGWAINASLATALVEAVARLHAAGAVHGDLRPSRVRIDAGLPCLAGPRIASTEEDPEEGGVFRGAAGWAAPEVLAGEARSRASDAYAVGLLLRQLVSGEAPAATRSPAALAVARRRPPLPITAPGVPAPVAAILDALVAPEPAHRPRLLEAARVLAAHSPSETRDRLSGDRAAWFAGPERGLRLRSRGLSLLTGRTVEEAARVIDTWIRMGLARWEGTKVALDPGVLDTVMGAPGGIRPVSRQLLLAVRSGGDPTAAALAAAASARLDGHREPARAALLLALDHLPPDSDGVRPLAEALVDLAEFEGEEVEFADDSVNPRRALGAVREARHVLGRLSSPAVEPLERRLDAALGRAPTASECLAVR